MNIARAKLEDVFVLAKVHVDAWQAAYRGVVPDSFFEQITVSKREASFRQFLLNYSPEETYVAEESEEVIGFLMVVFAETRMPMKITRERFGESTSHRCTGERESVDVLP